MGLHMARLEAQTVIPGQDGISVLKTGGTDALVSLMFPLAAAPASASPLLQFEFGFATDESEGFDTFFDSFSVTVQGSDPAQSALVLTADNTGVAWTPPNPGGIEIQPTEVTQDSVPNFALETTLALKFAYTVSFLLPAGLAGTPVQVFLDLFDNLNGTNSLAYVKDLRLPGPVRLQSSAFPEGPFHDDYRALLNSSDSTFTLAGTGTNLFFRITADRTYRLVEIKPGTNQLVITFAPVSLQLESTAKIGDAFVEEPDATLDEAARTFTLSSTGSARFYRVRSGVKSRLKAPRPSGDGVVLEYEFNP
jgi:hypothetical protein